ncbi:hypothetical protein FRC16_004647 [Serendipita sp. 398]|nr:hypothetical protein FRC16_004647 [Serendipita sp. 398]
MVAAFVCDIGGTKPTCINTYNNATSLPSSTRTSSQTGTSISFQSPSQDSSHGENNTPLIAGAAAGGAVALILIGLLAFCIVRKKPMREKVHKVKSVPRPSGRHSPLLTGPATPAPLLHNPEHANRYSSTLYNTPSYTMNTSATPSNSVLPLHRPGPPSTYDSATSEALMSQTNPSNLPYSPSVETSSLSPGISGRGANYYASTPIPHLGGTSISYSQTSPQTELGRTGSLAYGTQYGASTEAHLPWLQQETLSSSSSGTDSQPQRFVVSPPPPPFTPAPDPNMVPVWAQSQGRVISATAPGDRKARPSGQS